MDLNEFHKKCVDLRNECSDEFIGGIHVLAKNLLSKIEQTTPNYAEAAYCGLMIEFLSVILARIYINTSDNRLEEGLGFLCELIKENRARLLVKDSYLRPAD